MKKESENKNDNSEFKWFITVSITTFLLSILFSFISTTAISGLAIIPAIIILILVIFLGIVFDIIAVAVTVGEEADFHAKAAKKIKGAKTSIKLIRNSSKVANFFADVIGDIAGVLSGAIGALVSMKITEKLNLNFNVQFLISALVASLTVGGKALGKNFAKNNSTKIVNIVGNVINVFDIKK